MHTDAHRSTHSRVAILAGGVCLGAIFSVAVVAFIPNYRIHYYLAITISCCVAGIVDVLALMRSKQRNKSDVSSPGMPVACMTSGGQESRPMRGEKSFRNRSRRTLTDDIGLAIVGVAGGTALAALLQTL